MKHIGTDGQWVSGPLRATEWTGRKVGDFVVRLYWGDGDVTWVDFEVFEIAGCATPYGHNNFDPVTEDTALFMPRPGVDGAKVEFGMTPDLGSADIMAKGRVKWDGCTQVEIDAHADSHQEMRDLFEAVILARDLASRRMTSLDYLDFANPEVLGSD